MASQNSQNYNSSHAARRITKDFTEDHKKTIGELAENYRVNIEEGLSTEEVEIRIRENGPNQLSPKGETPAILLFIKELFTGFGLIYWIASILCILSFEPFGGDKPDIYNLILGILIFLVLLFSATFRFVQTQKAEAIIRNFQKLFPQQINVFRSKQWIQTNSVDLVVGDIIKVKTGDKIPADVRIIEVERGNAKVDKSIITGETRPVTIQVEPVNSTIIDANNLAFLGTTVSEGSMKCMVIGTGDKTYLGQIANLATTSKRSITTLEKDIYYLSFMICIIALSLTIFIIIDWAFYLRIRHPDAHSVSSLVITCMSIMVAFVPTGLPLAVTTSLTVIARAMRSYNVIVKNLSIIETLGSATVICSDKTGTITMNKMTMSHLWMIQNENLLEESVSLTGRMRGAIDMHKASQNRVTHWLRFMLGLSTLCNNCEVDRESGKLTGSPTEISLMEGALNHVDYPELHTAYPLKWQLSFNSQIKHQTNIHLMPREGIDLLAAPPVKSSLQPLIRNEKFIIIVKGVKYHTF